MADKEVYSFAEAEDINYCPTFMAMLDWFFYNREGVELIDDIVPWGDIAFTMDGTKYVMSVDAGCRTLSVNAIAGAPDFDTLNSELLISLESASEELGDNDEWSDEYLAEMNEEWGVA